VSALACALACAARNAHADDATDKAAAEALYELGHRLMDQGKYADACPKLEASQDLDPGVGTLLLLGDCDEKLGKFASAWGAFQAASALATSRSDSDRAKVGDLRASALKPRLNYVTFDVSAAALANGLEIRRSGKLVAKGAWGVALPIDPGSYEVAASAPGRQTWHYTLNVPNERTEPLVVRVPALAEAGAAAPPDTGPVAAAPPRSTSVQESGGGSTQKTVGAITAGIGAAGGIAAGVLTYLAWKKNSDSKGHCLAIPTQCSKLGVSERDDARRFANVATFVGIGAAVVFSTGTVLYLTAPSHSHSDSAFSVSVSSSF
jgi:serine/threonine-protein kinase